MRHPDGVSTVLALLAFTACNASPLSISFQSPSIVEPNGMQNVHIQYVRPIDGELSIHFGTCSSSSMEDTQHLVGRAHVGSHPLAKRHADWVENRPTRFVWLPPDDVFDGGCLHAFVDRELAGSSESFTLKKRVIRRNKAFADVADPMGPWFDGVEYLKQKEPDDTFVAQAKSKRIGILGAGMSGLMTSLLLESVGMHNWQILEASERLGGRVHTSYLAGTNPEDYQYQEMGPMRFPVSISDPSSNETVQLLDMRMVFQLAERLNELNGNDTSLAVNFIPFIQSSANMPALTTKRRADGTVPGVSELAANPSLADDPTLTYSNATAVAEAEAAYNAWIDFGPEKIAAMAANMFQAHKKAVEDGNFDFSEAGFLRYMLHTDLNITDQVVDVADYRPSWLFENVYFSASEWRTIDKGLSRLPLAFGPHVSNRTQFKTKIESMTWDEETEKTTVTWRTGGFFSPTTKSANFDYTIVAVPFSKVRLWKLPDYSSLLVRAIQRMTYGPSCKVALHYASRWWETLEHPIIGGCSSGVSIPGIGSICYPSYKLNSTGPGVLLASYSYGTEARAVTGMTEQEHVAYVQRAMVEIHGEIADTEWTGNYDRICWDTNEFQAGAWAEPVVGQQELYLPAYFQTEKHTVFVGEHTSYTHAWIFSALESAVRGTAQLLLDMGLVDEAKQVTETWMARWISM